MTIIKKSKFKAKIYCNICKENIIVELNQENKDYWDLPNDWEFAVIDGKPNCIHICPKHRLEFSQFVNEYVEWKKRMDNKSV